MTTAFDASLVRDQFPALRRQVAGKPVAFFDGPAGSQVPARVAEAVSRYLTSTNANHEGLFATARESDAILDEAHRAVADFLGTADPGCVAFGGNMTSLTFAASRAIAREWSAGDEILVTDLDHDANVSPWVLAAGDSGATVRRVGVHTETGTLDLDSLTSQLNDRTRLVAVAYASNVTGSINPLGQIVEQAHAVGARVFVDAVHYAPHGSIDVEALDCDFLACSAYKFFGPHLGMFYGKRELLESLTPYKLRPATETLPGRWMTGTQNHEGIAGVLETVEYLADIGRAIESDSALGRRDALQSAFHAITSYEQELAAHLLDGLSRFPDITVWGLTDPDRISERVPTVSFTHASRTPEQIAEFLGQRGIFVWHGNHYGLPFTEAAGLEPHGTLRVGILHYNTRAEVDRLLSALAEL